MKILLKKIDSQQKLITDQINGFKLKVKRIRFKY